MDSRKLDWWIMISLPDWLLIFVTIQALYNGTCCAANRVFWRAFFRQARKMGYRESDHRGPMADSHTSWTWYDLYITVHLDTSIIFIIYTVEFNHHSEDGGSVWMMINHWKKWSFMNQQMKNGGWTSYVDTYLFLDIDSYLQPTTQFTSNVMIAQGMFRWTIVLSDSWKMSLSS